MAHEFTSVPKLFLFLIISTLQISSIKGDYITINYTQRLDHFGYYGDTYDLTFVQKVFLDDSHWAGAESGAPIIVLFGGEAGHTYGPEVNGVMVDSGVAFKALLVHIQHRFYGNSIPLDSIDLAMADHRIRGCLTTQQALQDYAEIIMSLKANFSAFASPVIVMGCGYSGALAAWFRLTYPHIAIGALASSAPMLYYGNYTQTDGFCDIVSKDFEDFNPKCHEWIRKSWEKIDEVAAQPNGVEHLSHAFNTCRPLQSSTEVKQWLGQQYSFAAKYAESQSTQLNRICSILLSEEYHPFEGMLHALQGPIYNAHCFEPLLIEVESPFEPPTNWTTAWAWQRCTELVFPIGCGKPTMLPSQPFDRNSFDKWCQKRFGVSPRPRLPITFLRGRIIGETIQGFGGNIIISNGLRDPFSSGGILEDVSKTIIAIKTTQGSFCSDMDAKDNLYPDPKWLKQL
ncbi:Lysosomal Pro-X carboxypeptidase [Bienertia sinuspersici]